MLRRVLTRRRILIALLAGVAAAGLTLAVAAFFASSPHNEYDDQLPAPPTATSLRLSDLQRTVEVFGPFELVPMQAGSSKPETQDPAVVMVRQDGTIQVSTKWTVPFDNTSWSKTRIMKLNSLTVDQGYATFGTGLQRVYTVKCGQPFFFEEQPQQIYVIDTEGVQYTITTARAEAVRKSIK